MHVEIQTFKHVMYYLRWLGYDNIFITNMNLPYNIQMEENKVNYFHFLKFK